LPIETHVGRTPEIIESSKACIAVSGSVALELLYRAKPTTILYRVGKLDLKVGLFFKTAKYICLVNLLANKKLFPEHLTDRCKAQAIADHVLRWLYDSTQYEKCVGELRALKNDVATPGACRKAATFVLEKLTGNRRRAA